MIQYLATPFSWLCFALLLGTGSRRVARLIADDAIFAGLRARFYARFPPPHEVDGLDFRQLRWYPLHALDGLPDPGPLPRGRRPGFRRLGDVLVPWSRQPGIWLPTPLPEPFQDPGSGEWVFPTRWDGSHEGNPTDPTVPRPLRPPAFLGRLVSCPWCLTPYIGTIGALLVLPDWPAWRPIAAAMATAAGWWIAGMLAMLETRLGAR